MLKVQKYVFKCFGCNFFLETIITKNTMSLHLNSCDPDVFSILKREKLRQRVTLDLIASEVGTYCEIASIRYKCTDTYLHKL